ncbi:MAG: hypothetical protein IT376_17345 [Polyangiaceae bacterium]|nr:hypothetical protein [Polyangiaceae bacterium]
MRSLLAVVAVVACSGASPSAPAPGAGSAGADAQAVPAPGAAAPAPSRGLAPEDPCEAERERLRAAPALPGAPSLDARRHEVLARAKAAPVVFVRVPEIDPSAPREAVVHRAQLEASAAPAWHLSRVWRLLANREELARAVFLREGYLYFEAPAVAAAVVEHLELHHLFRERELVLERGGDRHRLLRERGGYHHADGPLAGQRAKLVLFDRAWAAGREPGPPLHRDLTAVREAAGADEIGVERLTEAGALVTLRVGDLAVPAALRARGAALELACESVAPGDRARVAAAREETARRLRAVRRLRAAIDLMVDEALPFDEPRTEEGQQDGNLRPAWLWAYRHGWDSYTFNDDGYPVFDAQGRPLVPQVCVDFVTDALERASGTWYLPRGRARERTVGGLDLDRLGIDNRRSVERLVEFAWRRPDLVDVVDLAPEERVPFFQRAEFYGHLFEHRARYREGDVITIHGLRSDGQLHYHSFFVVGSDPVSGMPTTLASNAGRPRLRTWEQEMRAAPRRSIRSRLRFRLGWLEPPTVDPIEPAAVADPDPEITVDASSSRSI